MQSSAKKFRKSWWKKKMPVGLAGEKHGSAVKYEKRFAEFGDEKASPVQGIFQGQAAAKIRVRA